MSVHIHTACPQAILMAMGAWIWQLRTKRVLKGKGRYPSCSTREEEYSNLETLPSWAYAQCLLSLETSITAARLICSRQMGQRVLHDLYSCLSTNREGRLRLL